MANEKKGLPFLKDYNIDKVDIIIYSVSLLLFIVALVTFSIVAKQSRDASRQIKIKQERINTFKELQNSEAKIKADYSKLPERAQMLYDRFMAEDDINSYTFFLQNIANKFKAQQVNIDPGRGSFGTETKSFTIPDAVAEYLMQKNVFTPAQFEDVDGGKKISLKFVKLSVRVNMELSFGNLIAFLYAMENSSKYTEVNSVNLYGSGDSTQKEAKVRVELGINCFGRSEEFKKQVLAVLPDNTQLIQSQNKVLVAFPTVSLGTNAQAQFFGRNEIIKMGGETKTVHPVFYAHTAGEIKCPPVVPSNFKYQAIVGDIIAFSDGTTNTFFGKTGSFIVAKGGKPIVGFEKLLLKEINSEKKTITVVNQGISKSEYPDCPDSKEFVTR